MSQGRQGIDASNFDVSLKNLFRKPGRSRRLDGRMSSLIAGWSWSAAAQNIAMLKNDVHILHQRRWRAKLWKYSYPRKMQSCPEEGVPLMSAIIGNTLNFHLISRRTEFFAGRPIQRASNESRTRKDTEVGPRRTSINKNLKILLSEDFRNWEDFCWHCLAERVIKFSRFDFAFGETFR